MSRKKKTRSLKSKLSVKTGSKKDFFKPGQKGKIPSQNKLAKHRHRSVSAYRKYLLENGLADTSSGQPSEADLWRATSSGGTGNSDAAPTPRPVIGKQARATEQVDTQVEPTAAKAPAKQPTNDASLEAHGKAFEDLSGDDLWDLLDND